MAIYIEDYAFITELLYGGYTFCGAGVKQCSKKIQSLFLSNDYGKLIEYRNSIRRKNIIEPQLIKAIDGSSAVRYLILGSLHDAEITALHFNKTKKSIGLELALHNCCHSFNLKADDKQQKILYILNEIEMQEDITTAFNFGNDYRYDISQLLLNFTDKIELKLFIGKHCPNGHNEFIFECTCSEMFFCRAL